MIWSFDARLLDERDRGVTFLSTGFTLKSLRENNAVKYIRINLYTPSATTSTNDNHFNSVCYRENFAISPNRTQ